MQLTYTFFVYLNGRTVSNKFVSTDYTIEYFQFSMIIIWAIDKNYTKAIVSDYKISLYLA